MSEETRLLEKEEPYVMEIIKQKTKLIIKNKKKIKLFKYIERGKQFYPKLFDRNLT